MLGILRPRDCIVVTCNAHDQGLQRTHYRRRHLIQSMLRTEEARLKSFGIARMHRTRLINPKRVGGACVAPSGDFEPRLDSGQTSSATGVSRLG
jgi:DNA-binding LytR/AlgR family response regulator